MTQQKQVSHRSSETGKFVTEKYAERNPRTTEREVIKHPQPAQPPKKK